MQIDDAWWNECCARAEATTARQIAGGVESPAANYQSPPLEMSDATREILERVNTRRALMGYPLIDLSG